MIEISISNVHKNFGFNPILKGATFEVYTGERVGLVGKNGAGKTTLFNLLLGNEQPDKGLATTRKGATVGYLEQIHQSVDASLPQPHNRKHVQHADTDDEPELTAPQTVSDILKSAFSEVFDLEGRLRVLELEMGKDNANMEKLFSEYTKLQDKFVALDGYRVDEDYSRIVRGFKLEALLGSAFAILSGGEKTIVKLATILLKKPDILLLDEPTNHLDLNMLEWLEAFLAKYQGTVLMISHDRRFLDKATTKTILVERGVCDVYNGNYSFHLEEKERRLIQEFNEYKTQERKIEAMKAAIKRYRQWGYEGDNEKFFIKAKELEKRLEKMEILTNPKAKERKLSLNFNTERGSNDVLRVFEMCFGYDERKLFDKFTMNLHYGENLCLEGPNGAGKSTLFKLILGELKPTSGSLTLGHSVNIGYIPQEISFVDKKASVLDTFKQEIVCTEGDARNILAKYYFIGDAVFKRTANLSGGEKVLLKLAMLIQKNINFLMLDEPTNHIDIVSREILEDALLDFKGTLMFISHDRYFIEKLAGKKIEIGRLYA